jgi:lipopolysaccharide assembly outer membrane protein LptD (OstA)
MIPSVPLRLKPALLFILPCLFALSQMRHTVLADAYLAEDKVYYGADSFSVDYEQKIITAVGNAYFKKETRRVDADRIVIHYAVDRKIAYFYGNVIIVDETDKSRIDGNYAEARFRDDYYFVEGNTVYSDEKRRVTSRRIESRKDEGYNFIDEVRYSDGTYAIASSLLHVKDDVALFKGDAHAVTFQDRVLYIQREGEGDDNSLVIQSDVMRYFRDGDLFVLIGNVYMLNGSYTVRASVVRYRREEKLLEAVGDIVVWDGDKYVYCNNLEYNVDTDSVLFFKEVKGVFRPKKAAKGNS